MPTFSSVDAVKRYILQKCEKAVENTGKEIHMVIDGCLNQYYSEFDPDLYIRTGNLLHSLVYEGVKSTGNGFEAEVYFDASALNYPQGAVLLKDGTYGWATWGAEEVLDTAMHGSHGGKVGGTAIWDESMSELGDIVALIKNELIKAGLPVR